MISAPYSNETVGRFFSFLKVAKSDWSSKLSEENIEALLRINIEGTEIEDFIKEHCRDAAVFWWDATERRKGGNGKQKKYKKRYRKTKRFKFTNKFIDASLESSSDKNEGNVI